VRKRLELLLCLAALGLLGAAVLLPAVVAGNVPADVDAIFSMPPWQEASPAAPESADGPRASRDQLRYYTWYAFLNHAAGFQDPKALAWNPLEGCGTPFLAVWRTRCLSPFSVPFYILPLGQALWLSLWLKLLVAGWGAFYAARRLGFAMPLAFAVGVAFEFSGPVWLSGARPLGDVVPWLPLLLVNVERLAIGQAAHWPLGAAVVALMALGGEPEALAGAMIFALVYVVSRRAWDGAGLRSTAGSVAALCAAGVFGLGLAGVQVTPFVEFLREAVPVGAEDTTARFRPLDLVVCFLPHLLDAAQTSGEHAGAAASTHVARLLHVGLVQLCLLPLWLAVRRFVAPAQRRRVEAMLLAAVLMTALAVVWERLLGGVPVARLLGPQHFLTVNALVLALAAAAAVDEWLALNADQCRSALLRLLLGVPLLLAAAGLCAYAARHAGTQSALWPQLLVAGALFVGVCALLTVTLLRPSLRIMGYGLAALTFLALVWAFAPGAKHVHSDRLFPDTDLIKALRATGERINGGNALAQWPLGANLIPQTRSPGGVVLRRQAAFLARAEADPFLLRRAGSSSLLLTRADLQGAFAPLRPALDIEHAFPTGAVLFHDPEGTTRARLVYEGRNADTFDPAALSADAAPLIEGAVAPTGPAASAIRAAVRPGESPARVTIDVDSPRAGVLVLADTYYPGWKAAVDGKPTPVFPVDGMFRGIYVKEGPHEVTFYYNPFMIRLGLYITLGAAVVLLVELRHLVRQRFRNR